MFRRRDAANSRRRDDFRHHLTRHAENREQFVIPIAPGQIHEHGARRVGVIGHVRCAVGQLPDQPRIDIAEQKVGRAGVSLIQSVIQNPADFAARKIGVDHQAGFSFDGFSRLERIAKRGSSTALPNDGGRDRLPRAAIPDNGCLSLIGNADGRNVPGGRIRGVERSSRCVDLRAPDRVGVLLHPARMRINAIDRARLHRHTATFLIVKRGAGAGGSFVQGKNIWHSRIIMKIVCSFAIIRRR